jgi:hypothetical protein
MMPRPRKMFTSVPVHHTTFSCASDVIQARVGKLYHGALKVILRLPPYIMEDIGVTLGDKIALAVGGGPDDGLVALTKAIAPKVGYLYKRNSALSRFPGIVFRAGIITATTTPTKMETCLHRIADKTVYIILPKSFMKMRPLMGPRAGGPRYEDKVAP